MSMKQAPSYLSMFGFLFGLYMGYQINPGDQLSDDSVQSCFTPGENCTALIVQHIDNAKSEIRVQAYSFTSPPIIEALIKARQRGVNVRILIDKSNKDKMNVEPLLPLTNAFGNDIKIDVLPGIAHNKVMIIDDIVITGSFNFTKAAQHRNAENVLILKNKTIHSRYHANWEKRNKLAFDPNVVVDNEKMNAILSERSNRGNANRGNANKGNANRGNQQRKKNSHHSVQSHSGIDHSGIDRGDGRMNQITNSKDMNIESMNRQGMNSQNINSQAMGIQETTSQAQYAQTKTIQSTNDQAIDNQQFNNQNL